MKPYSENKKLKVIEMVAGPGAGKTAAALLLAGHMKARGYKVEYVREIPKDLVWDGRNNSDHSMFTEQDWILANQNNLFRRLVAHDIEYVVTDTSMLLGLVYVPKWHPSCFNDYLLEIYRSYHNITFYIDRGDIPYVQDGRNQTQQEANSKDVQSLYLLGKYCIPFHKIEQKNGDYDYAALQMLNIVENMFGSR